MADRAFIHRPFTGHEIMKPTGVLLLKLDGQNGFRNAGNYEEATYEIESDPEDIWSPQTPERTKILTIYNDVKVTVNFSLSQAIPIVRTMIMQSDNSLVLEQAAVVDKVIDIVDFEAGTIMPLGYRNVTKVTVAAAGAGGAAYVEDKNFQYDGATGHLEIIEHPGKADKASVKVTVSAGVVAGRKLWGIASKFDLIGAAMFRSTNKWGPKQLVEFNRVQFSGDGARTLGSNASDPATYDVIGDVLADPTQPTEYQYGRVTDLP